MRSFKRSSLVSGVLTLSFLLSAGAAFAGDEAVKGYDRESMQKLFDQMAVGTLEGMSADDRLMTGSVKKDAEKGGSKEKR